MAGRLYAEPARKNLVVPFLRFVALAMLPDMDVFWVMLGVPDRDLIGHRGATHTPLFALVVGLLVWLWLRDRRPHAWRLALLATLLVASHGLLDALAQDGRGIMFLWPLSSERFHMPWRPIPDAPVGLEILTRAGCQHLALEFVYFAPFTLYALWRRPRNSPTWNGGRVPIGER